MNENAHSFAALCAVCAARLQGQRELAVFSLLLSGLTLAGLAVCAIGGWPASAPLLSALGAASIVGLVERYLAVRVRIDARLFGDMARGNISDLRVLDQALTQFQLTPAAKAGRTLTQRTAGALRLVRWHTRLVVLQVVLMAGAAASTTGVSA